MANLDLNWDDIPWDIEPETGDLTLEQCLKAGHEGVFISNEKYHQLPGVSGSKLPLLMLSNKHLDHAELFKLGETPALKFGTLLHTMVLEPDEVENRYAVLPKFATKAETGLTIVQSNKNFYADNAGKLIVDATDMAKAKRMAKNVRAIAGDIIDAGIKERSLFVDLDGIVCKCRLDIELDGSDWDLKSISPTKGADLSDTLLERHIKALNYHLSAAFRNIVRRALGIEVGGSFLIFASTAIGHIVKIIQLEPGWIAEAEAQVQDMLEDRRFYLASGIDRKPVAIDDRTRKSKYVGD